MKTIILPRSWSVNHTGFMHDLMKHQKLFQIVSWRWYLQKKMRIYQNTCSYSTLLKSPFQCQDVHMVTSHLSKLEQNWQRKFAILITSSLEQQNRYKDTQINFTLISQENIWFGFLSSCLSQGNIWFGFSSSCQVIFKMYSHGLVSKLQIKSI